MALRKFVERLTKPIDQVDREQLAQWCSTTGCPPLDEIAVRKPVRVGGEVRSIRIVPRAGADALEATIRTVTARSRPCSSAGARSWASRPAGACSSKVSSPRTARANVMYNPLYEFV